MQIADYAAQVQQQLISAAALGDDRARDVAAILARAADPAVRLAILAAVAAAADEVTTALLDSPGAPAVAVHLDGDEVRVSVTAGAVSPPVPVRPDEGDTSARISLRLSEALKADIDQAAGAAGVSVNAWLLRAAAAALGGPSTALPGSDDSRPGRGRRVTGWING